MNFRDIFIEIYTGMFCTDIEIETSRNGEMGAF